MFDLMRLMIERLEASQEALGRETGRREATERELSRALADRPRPADVVAMLDAMAEGRKIDAIKIHRFLTGYSLKDSKDAIERVMDRTGGKAVA